LSRKNVSFSKVFSEVIQLKVVKATYHQVQTLVIRSVRAPSCYGDMNGVLLFEQCQHTAPSQPFHRQLSGW